MGRFITRDPIGWAGGLNLYGYVGNNPVNSVDPSGNSPALVVAAGFGGVRGALSASDDYVSSHADSYTVHGHIWANTKGAAAGIVNTFNPVVWWNNLSTSATNLGTVIGCYEGGYGSATDVAIAAADTGIQSVALAFTMKGVAQAGKAGWQALAAWKASRTVVPPPVSKPSIVTNKQEGDLFRDEVAATLESQGRTVTKEVVKWTPLGMRKIDIEVSRNGTTLGGIEAKLGQSRYHPSQRAKDWWLTNVSGYPVNLIRRNR